MGRARERERERERGERGEREREREREREEREPICSVCAVLVCFSEFRSCMKVEVAVPGSPTLIVHKISVDVKQH